MSQTIVRCPIDGVVLEKNVEQGTIITSGQSFNSTGTSLVQIGDISKMYVSVSVDETDLAAIRNGQSVQFTVDAFKGVSFMGEVARISPEATVTNNVTTYPVRVEIDNSHPMFSRMRPGMNATCKFVVSHRDNVVAVPAPAVHRDAQGSYVEIAVRGKSVTNGTGLSVGGTAGGLLSEVQTQRRGVEVGLAGNESVEVVKRLQAGEKLIVQTITLEQSGSAVQTPAASPFGGGGPPPGGPSPDGRSGGGGR